MSTNQRQIRGALIAATCRVDRRKDGYWTVPSQSGVEKTYRVDLEEMTCTCLDHTEGGHVCKHWHSVKFTFQRDYRSDGSMVGMMQTTVETPDMTLTKRVTYRQDWKSYNLAQSTERHRFQELLFDLTRGLTEPPARPGRGRKPHTVKDSIFAMGLKVYGTLSSRRTSCDFKDAHEAGYLSKPIPGMKVSQFFENETFTPILKSLIAYAARPLRAVETAFAIDSSGFGSHRFDRWFDFKYGAMKKKAAWVKTHIACGVKTNIVTAVRILDQHAGDCPQFVPLVRETANGFEISEVSADKAYISMDNFEEVAKMGAQAYIAMKCNTKASAGGAYEKAFHLFKLNEEEYMRHYHRRSNVESTFSMIKRKFGDAVRSRTDTAMVNEVLTKILAHNICVLIQEQQELGVEPIFWGEEKSQETNVLPMRVS
jgi:Transposase DDE domain